MLQPLKCELHVTDFRRVDYQTEFVGSSCSWSINIFTQRHVVFLKHLNLGSTSEWFFWK